MARVVSHTRAIERPFHYSRDQGMPEQLLQNQDKLNRKCKQFLLDLKVRPDQSVLYCLQLMEWALDSGEIVVKDSRLRNSLEELMGWNQADAYRFLKLAEDGELYPVFPDLDQVKSPRDLAWRLLDVLDSKLGVHLSDYPRPIDRLP